MASSVVREMLREVAENPRRVVHSFKVGLALALTSLTVLQEDLFEWLGVNAIWAVMTVVVVFELTAGATICKGSNRAFGTFFAGTLALAVECLADLAGPIGEKYVVVISVFVIGTFATYTRFCEPFKSNYEYGVVIFLLTFSLIIVSSYRVTNNVQLAVSRLLNIVLGGVICLVMTILIKPVWASEDLHNIITNNFDNLAQALEGFMKAYFKEERYKATREDDPIYESYKAVLVSKSSEESLANFASWEPRWQSINGSKGVWKQYVQVGGMLRTCTYTVASLHGCLVSNVQGRYTFPKDVSSACQNLTIECITILKELGENLKQKERSRTKEDLVRLLLQRVEDLKLVMGYPNEMSIASPFHVKHPMSPNHVDEANTNASHSIQAQINVCDATKESFTGILAIATVAFLLTELVSQIMHLLDAQKVLETLSKFREPKTRLTSIISKRRNASMDSSSIQFAE